MRQTSLFVLLSLLAACRAPYAGVPLAVPLSYSEAEAAFYKGDLTTAAEGFTAYLATGQRAYRARAYYQLARTQYALENYEVARDALAELESEFPDRRGPQTMALRGDIAYALGNRMDAILQWEKAWRDGSEADRAVLRPRIEGAVEELDREDALKLASVVSEEAIYDMLVPHLPGVAEPEQPTTPEQATAPDVAQRAAVDALVEDGRLAADVESTAALAEEPLSDDAVPTQTHPTERVAALLPLTGPDRIYGRRTLNGLRLAFADSPQTLAVRDTGGDPTLAADLVTALATDPTLLAVIGPLRNSEAATAAPRAEELKIPLLLLSQRKGPAGRYILHTGITQGGQARELVDYAVDALHVTRFGVVYPDDGYGRAFLKSFREAASQRGTKVIGTSPYIAGQKDFALQAAAVRAWVEEGAVKAVFIPDAAPTATAVAAALRSSAPDVILLGSESWNQAGPLADAGAAIEGAVFTDTFFPGGDMPSTQSFVARFRLRNGYPPTVFEAQAFDTAMLVRRAINQGARTRERLLSDLRRMEPFEGAGRVHTTAEGLQRDIFLLRVRGGKVEALGQRQ